MSTARTPTANRNVQLTSASSAIDYSANPIGFVQVRGAGNVVMADEAGSAVTFTNCKTGDILVGPFSAFTSTTCARLWLSDARPVPSAAETSLSELYTTLQTAQAQINVDLSGAILAAGLEGGRAAMEQQRLSDTRKLLAS